ncbi:MAG: hypothetical protein WCJ30_19900, partial [Deltaproteobacteria bacterium]
MTFRPDERGEFLSRARGAPAALGLDEDIPHDAGLASVVNRVRRGIFVSEGVFDSLYPPGVVRLSRRHWTPIAVARRAVEMLVVDASTRVLDVGAGVGKLCLVGALTTGATFTGIEQRAPLVGLARAVAQRYGVTRATYLHGVIGDVDWSQYDAFYFFNPFGENRLEPAEWIDAEVELGRSRYERDLGVALAALERARAGTRVVTYHGLGAELA